MNPETQNQQSRGFSFPTGSRELMFFLLMLLTVTAVICSGRIGDTARYLTMTAPFTVVLAVRVRRGWVDFVLSVLFIGSWLAYFYAVIAGYTGGVL